MKRATLPIFFAGSKRWATFIVILVLYVAGAPVCKAQGVSEQVNIYIKTQVKETTIKGVILVAENMTDWLSQANVSTENPKKTVQVSRAGVPIVRAHATTIKPRNSTSAKPLKRS